MIKTLSSTGVCGSRGGCDLLTENIKIFLGLTIFWTGQNQKFLQLDIMPLLQNTTSQFQKGFAM